MLVLLVLRAVLRVLPVVPRCDPDLLAALLRLVVPDFAAEPDLPAVPEREVDADRVAAPERVDFVVLPALAAEPLAVDADFVPAVRLAAPALPVVPLLPVAAAPDLPALLVAVDFFASVDFFALLDVPDVFAVRLELPVRLVAIGPPFAADCVRSSCAARCGVQTSAAQTTRAARRRP